jgi:CubicO group peptidase (beta-lactamase class C family)
MNLQVLIHAVDEQDLHVSNIVVGQNGNIIAEHDFAEEKRVLLWSASKTITSMAIGIAEEEGYLKIEDKLSKYFRNPAETFLDQINVRNLLCMGTGQKKDPLSEAVNSGKPLDDVEKLFFCRTNRLPAGNTFYIQQHSHIYAIEIDQHANENEFE